MTQMLQRDESTGAKVPAPGKRTQAERRASSRAKILDAAVNCLMTEGYAATTTLRVQARAGVNRGTLLHYFPTRATLLAAAVDHLYAARRQQLYELLLRLPTGGSRIDSAIDILWEIACSPLLTASIQLWTASVNDAELAQALRAHHSVFDETDELCAALFGPELAAHPRFHAVRDLLLHAVRGAAVVRSWGALDLTPAVLQEWKTLARTLLEDEDQA